MRFSSRATAVVALAAVLTLTGCSKPVPAGADGPRVNDTTTLGPPVTLNLVGYSVAETANRAAAAEWAKLNEGSNVTFKTYPSLNHLFMSGKGKSTPAEYGQPGRVDETVIDDIVGWLGSTSSPAGR